MTQVGPTDPSSKETSQVTPSVPSEPAVFSERVSIVSSKSLPKKLAGARRQEETVLERVSTTVGTPGKVGNVASIIAKSVILGAHRAKEKAVGSCGDGKISGHSVSVQPKDDPSKARPSG